jgi:hypothetical protein
VTLSGTFLAAAVLVCAAEALPGSVGSKPKPPTPTTSNAAVFVSPSGNDSSCRRGKPAKPCLTFNRAYELAQQGDVVQVAGGDYPDQTIAYDSSKSGSGGSCRLSYDGDGTFSSSSGGCVTFEPAPGAMVQVGCHTQTTVNLNMSQTSTIPVSDASCFYANNGTGIRITFGRSTFNCTGKDATDLTGCSATPACQQTSGGSLCGYDSGSDIVEGGISVSGASYVDLKGLTVAGSVSVGSDGTHSPTDVILDGDSASFAYMQSSSYVFVENGTLGPYNGSQPNTFSHCNYCGIYKTTVENEQLSHCDGTLSGQNTNYYCHGDGFYVNNNTNLYFVASTFYGNDSFHIFFSHGAGNPGDNPGPVTIVNNYFGDCGPSTCSAAVSIRDDSNGTLNGYTIEGNSSEGGWLIGANSGMSNVQLTNWQISGNIGISIPCSAPTGVVTYGLTVTRNIVARAACDSGANPTASGNRTYQDIGLGGSPSISTLIAWFSWHLGKRR